MNAAEMLALQHQITDARCAMASLMAMGAKPEHFAKLQQLLHEAETMMAIAKAKALVAELGQDHPTAMLAMIDAVNFGDPEFMDKALAECGINLPAPSHVNNDGEPVLLSVELADSLGVPHETLVEDIQRLGDQAGISFGGVAHRIQ